MPVNTHTGAIDQKLTDSRFVAIHQEEKVAVTREEKLEQNHPETNDGVYDTVDCCGTTKSVAIQNLDASGSEDNWLSRRKDIISSLDYRYDGGKYV